MTRTKLKLRIVLLVTVLLLAAGAPKPAQALPFGIKSVATRTSTGPQHQAGSWWKLFLKRFSRYAMAAS